jgi:hypothetical protein
MRSRSGSETFGTDKAANDTTEAGAQRLPVSMQVPNAMTGSPTLVN